MLTMVIFSTKSTETDLLFLCASRGRHADIPYYESVDTIDWNNGFITFARLDCAPAQGHKVGFAGNLLITTESFEHEVAGWLRGWGIAFTVRRETVPSPEAARALVARLRQKHLPRGGHARAAANARRRVKIWQDREDRILAMALGTKSAKPSTRPGGRPGRRGLTSIFEMR